MELLQTIIPIVYDSSPTGPWTHDDTLMTISVTLGFFLLYVLFIFIDKLRGETWYDAFSIEEGSVVKILFGWFFFCTLFAEIIMAIIYGIYLLIK